jgi:hypothetical protein
MCGARQNFRVRNFRSNIRLMIHRLEQIIEKTVYCSCTQVHLMSFPLCFRVATKSLGKDFLISKNKFITHNSGYL